MTWNFTFKVDDAVSGHLDVARFRNFNAGDIVGVGCLVDSDHDCPICNNNLEQFCSNASFTYNSPDKHGTAPVTYGGYSESIVVDERFVLKVPGNLDLAGVAPLLCAGITTYSPIRRWGDLKGKKVGVVGLGGLGHMGVKFARAFGAHVVVLTTSPGRVDVCGHSLRPGYSEVLMPVCTWSPTMAPSLRRPVSTSSPFTKEL